MSTMSKSLANNELYWPMVQVIGVGAKLQDWTPLICNNTYELVQYVFIYLTHTSLLLGLAFFLVFFICLVHFTVHLELVDAGEVCGLEGALRENSSCHYSWMVTRLLEI